ncbi:MAG: hypothetical protein LW853_06485 [Rickettsiales bacterium]|jgi:hypothetical protein|nr:hypothetical protein [Rickettsiales bacterium]
MRFLGLIPLGRQWIVTSTPQPEDHPRGVFRIRDKGVGDIAKVWDHLIVIEARPDGRTAYRDEVEVRAGVLTLGVWLFAQGFYRHRQARWRRLVRQGFRYPGQGARRRNPAGDLCGPAGQGRLPPGRADGPCRGLGPWKPCD